MKDRMKTSMLVAALALGTVGVAPALAEDVVSLPNLSYRTGPFAATGIPLMNGQRDYMAMLNARDGGVNGVIRADARDEKAGEELRAVVNGAIAAGRLVSGQDKRIEAMLNAVQVTGTGKTAAVSFTVPPEILDVINGVAAMKNLHEDGQRPSRGK